MLEKTTSAGLLTSLSACCSFPHPSSTLLFDQHSVVLWARARGGPESQAWRHVIRQIIQNQSNSDQVLIFVHGTPSRPPQPGKKRASPGRDSNTPTQRAQHLGYGFGKNEKFFVNSPRHTERGYGAGIFFFFFS